MWSVELEMPSGRFSGRNNIGGLVGHNLAGTIINSYARGQISNTDGNQIGGLIGKSDRGRIINSYADVNFPGTVRAGGLVGGVVSSEIVNSYATGDIAAGFQAGVLANTISGNTQIKNSYAIGTLNRKIITGGLIGNSPGTLTRITDSYWDSDTSGQTRSAGGTGKTTVQLQSPTTATGIYANWSPADWDFGNTQSYPMLRYNKVDGTVACDSDSETALPRCGTLLSGQLGPDGWSSALLPDPLGRGGLNALFFREDNIELNTAKIFGNQSFSSLLFEYNITIPVARLQLEPYAINDAASISIIKDGDTSTDYFNGKSSGEISDDIMSEEIGTETNLKVIVADDAISTTTYSFTIITIPDEVPFSITADGAEVDKVNEGEEITLTAEFGDSGIFKYSWQQEKLLTRATEPSSTATLTLRIPENFIKNREVNTEDIEFTLEATMNDDTAPPLISTRTVTIMKFNNGVPNFTPTVTTSTISIATEDDPDGMGSAIYTWEQRSINNASWNAIAGATMMSTYRVPSQDAGDIRYRVQISHTDAQDFSTTATLGPFRTEIDDDDDGLIDIYYLEDLDNVRYQTDGSGYKTNTTAAKITLGCPNDTCMGYELRRDLDFATTQSYINAETNKAAWTVDDFDDDDDVGWDPIGSLSISNINCSDTNNNNCFSSTFEGNGNRIFNLQINRDDTFFVGLFAANSGSIHNIGLSGLKVDGGGYVGSLVGVNEGTIMNSNAVGWIRGHNQNYVGGLVGYNLPGTMNVPSLIINSYARGEIHAGNSSFVGGLIGQSDDSKIINSYADVNIIGEQNVGGLVGQMNNVDSHNSRVVNSYATGDVGVTALQTNLSSGLVGGSFDGKVQIDNSYTISSIGNLAGSLLRENFKSDGSPLTLNNSYWDIETSTQTRSAGSTGKTTAELQDPTADIYRNWSSDDWDFGTTQTYPVLRHNKVENVAACDSVPKTALPRCGTLLSGQLGPDGWLSALLPGQLGRGGLNALFFRVGGSELNAADVFRNQPFSSLIFDYNVMVSFPRLQLEPYTLAGDASVSIMKEGDNTNYFDRKSSGDTSDFIVLETDGTATELKVVVADDAISTTYTFAINVSVKAPFTITNFDGDEVNKINEGEEITLIAREDNIEALSYSWQQEKLLTRATEASSTPTLTLSIPEDFIKGSDADTQDIVFTLKTMLIDDDTAPPLIATRTVTIMKFDNGVPTFTPTVTTSTISIATEDDPDGMGSAIYTWEQRSINNASWNKISGATSTYRVPSQDAGDTRYRVQINHTDGQGYMSTTATLGPFRTNIDDDANGLIDIYYLEDLDNVRYQTDGSGYQTSATAAKITRGCPTDRLQRL